MKIIPVFILLFFFLTPVLFYFLFILNTILMRGHDLPTSRLAIKKILKIITTEVKDKNKENFYDLGSGRGEVVFAIKENFPYFSVFGIEKASGQLFFARLKNFLLRQEVLFQKKDLFETNLKGADIIYTYLWYDLMPPLEEKLQKELKEGAMVITNTSHFPNWQPKDVHIIHPKKPDFEKLFVYIKKTKN